MGSFLGSKNGLGHQTCPKTAPRGATTFSESPFWRLLEPIFLLFLIFCLKRGVLKYVPFFLRFLGRPELSTGWAHMQSVHAGAVQTHFFNFAFFLKNSFLEFSFWVYFGCHFLKKSQFLMQQSAPKNVQKKSAPPDSNTHLFQCREAPREAASRTRFLNNKQQSGQQKQQLFLSESIFEHFFLEWVIFGIFF